MVPWDLAPFGGLEWQVNPKLRVLAEYSSDDYGLEQGYFDQKSRVLMLGLDYIIYTEQQLLFLLT